jgi:hypothetical protein
MRIRRIPHRLLHISRVAWYNNKTTYPRISADAFRDICDVSFYSKGDKPHTKLSLRDSHVVYCNSDFIEQFIEEDLRRFSPKVLLVGNSDRDFVSFDISATRTIKAVFLQNSIVRSKRIHALPIGIENLSIAMNSRPVLFDNQYISRSKSERVLVGPFGNSHPSRKELVAIARSNPGIFEVAENFVGPKRYADFSSTFQFIACPRGNGLDTHRFWETLYRGGIPVVIEGEWSRNMATLGLPLLSISQWDSGLIERSIRENPEHSFAPSKIESLWMPFWDKKIKSILS